MKGHQISILFLLLVGLGLYAPTVSAVGQDDQVPVPGSFAGWSTNGPAVYRLLVQSTHALPGPPVMYLPPPTELPPEIRLAMLMFRAVGNVRILTNTTRVWDHFLAESLNNAVWTNFIAHTNGRNMKVWSKRSYPIGWPMRPPVAQWNTNSLMWGMKGLTAISPSWEQAVNFGQAPITALTRRHGYALGHAMGPDRIGNIYSGKKVWFLTVDNVLIQTTVLREVVRTRETSGRDYSILLFSSDLPDSIQPMRVVATRDVFGAPPAKYLACPGALSPIFKTEQTGGVSAEVPGFTLDTYKGGDSGSPNMLPMPGELVFWTGRSTSGVSREMQADMDELCRLERLDPRKYQLPYVDLSKYPDY